MAIVNLNYGYNGSGKLYSYNDTKGTHRAGDIVVIEVTAKNGKVYKTLGKIHSTHGSGTAGEKDTEEYLSMAANREGGQGIGLKKVLGGDKEQLPGYEKYANDKTIKDPSAAWQRDSNERYAGALKQRLINMEV